MYDWIFDKGFRINNYNSKPIFTTIMNNLLLQFNAYFNNRLNPGKFLIRCFWFAIAFILLYDFFLVQIPGFFQWAHKLGSIFYKISFAFVTSYIFYWVNVILKKKDDKKNLSPYLANETFFILQRTKRLFSEIGEVSGREFKVPYPSEEELSEACKLISMNSYAKGAKIIRGNLVPLTWAENLYIYRNEMDRAIQKMFNLMHHLESKHIKLLNEIAESSFFNIISYDALEDSEGSLRKSDLTSLSNILFKLGLLVQSLEKYYEEKLKSFSPRFTKSMG